MAYASDNRTLSVSREENTIDDGMGGCILYKLAQTNRHNMCALVHRPLTKGLITQRFLSEGVMETFLIKKNV
jgi:hypothetical protein